MKLLKLEDLKETGKISNNTLWKDIPKNEKNIFLPFKNGYLPIKPLVGYDKWKMIDIFEEFYDLVKIIEKFHLENITGVFRVQRVLPTETKGRIHTSTFRIKGTRRTEKDITFNFPQNRLVNHLTGETKELYKEKK